MTNKIKLVLDLDETLIHTIILKENILLNINEFPSENFSIIQLPNFFGLVFIRPYLFEFLKFIFNNFCVSIWTAGNTMYCKEVLKIILTQEQFDKTIFILARDKNNYIDVKTNKIYKNVTPENEIIKPLELLWNDDEFKKHYNENNTLLIDNDLFVIKSNPYNSIIIKEFNKYSIDDFALCNLYNWLNNVKNCKDIQKLDKNISKISSNCSKLSNQS